jgi:hypothetical protein
MVKTYPKGFSLKINETKTENQDETRKQLFQNEGFVRNSTNNPHNHQLRHAANA